MPGALATTTDYNIACLFARYYSKNPTPEISYTRPVFVFISCPCKLKEEHEKVHRSAATWVHDDVWTKVGVTI